MRTLAELEELGGQLRKSVHPYAWWIHVSGFALGAIMAFGWARKHHLATAR